MQDSHLATAGGDLKVWESGSFAQLHSFSPSPPAPFSVSSSVISNSWSCDTSCIASVLKGKDSVVLTYYRNSKYLSTELQTPGISQPSFLQFPRASQNLLIVSAKSDLYFYDIGKKKVRKSFNLKSDITCFAPNQTDSYVAAGSSNGSVFLLTVASNQISVPLTAPKCLGQKITSLRYNLLRPAFLGSSCESGQVSFWDCNANKNLFNLAEHAAPCTGFTFSPVNDALAASCGLDKRLICHDTKSRKSVINLLLESPCTAVDFDLDGRTLAVGTTRGRVIVYDLRNTTSWLKNFQAHNSRVESLVFKHQIDKTNVSLVMSAVKSKSKLRSQKSLSALKTVQEETKENLRPERTEVAEDEIAVAKESPGSPLLSDTSVFSTVDPRRESISSQLFSPLKDVDISFPTNTPNPASGNSSRRVSEVRLSTEGLFSPVREGPASGSNSLNLGRRTPFSNFSTPIMSPLTSIQEEPNSQPGSPHPPPKPILSKEAIMLGGYEVDQRVLGERAKQRLNGEIEEQRLAGGSEMLRLDRLDKFVKQHVHTSTASPEFLHQLQPQHQDSASDDRLLSQNEFQSVMSAFPGALLPHYTVRSNAAEMPFHSSSLTCGPQVAAASNTTANISTSPAPNQQFSINLVQSVVNEAMEEWCSLVESSLSSMHYGLIRQLQRQQEETQFLLAEVAGINQLKEENERLKRENIELKKFFGNIPPP